MYTWRAKSRFSAGYAASNSSKRLGVSIIFLSGIEVHLRTAFGGGRFAKGWRGLGFDIRRFNSGQEFGGDHVVLDEQCTKPVLQHAPRHDVQTKSVVANGFIERDAALLLSFQFGQ